MSCIYFIIFYITFTYVYIVMYTLMYTIIFNEMHQIIYLVMGSLPSPTPTAYNKLYDIEICHFSIIALKWNFISL